MLNNIFLICDYNSVKAVANGHEAALMAGFIDPKEIQAGQRKKWEVGNRGEYCQAAKNPFPSRILAGLFSARVGLGGILAFPSRILAGHFFTREGVFRNSGAVVYLNAGNNAADDQRIRFLKHLLTKNVPVNTQFGNPVLEYIILFVYLGFGYL